MTISLTQHDRQLLIERFLAAEKMDKPEDVVTMMYVEEIHIQQRHE